jgi:hypothetical protein
MAALGMSMLLSTPPTNVSAFKTGSGAGGAAVGAGLTVGATVPVGDSSTASFFEQPVITTTDTNMITKPMLKDLNMRSTTFSIYMIMLLYYIELIHWKLLLFAFLTDAILLFFSNIPG